MLIGRDRRVARLTGGDRLAPTPQLVSGSAAFEALAAAGLTAVAGRAGGGSAFAALSGAGVSLVALPSTAPSPIQLQALQGAGSSTVALPADGGASFSVLEAAGEATVTRFVPSMVPEVAGGYLWDPALAIDSGLATFSMPEAQGKTAYNQITPSLAAAPTIGTINGQPVIQQINRTAPSIDSLSRTSATQQRGWTSSIMLCGWFSAPAGGPGTVFLHGRGAINFMVSLGTTRIDVTAHDGVSAKEYQHPMPAGWLSSGPVYIEGLVNFAASATNRLQAWVNRVQKTPSVAVAFGQSLRDDAAFLSFSGQTSDGSGFNLSADFAHGIVCLCDGIPSDAARDAIYNHRRLDA